MINERDLWTCALLLCVEHGDDAPTVISGRLATSFQADDQISLTLWLEIERRVSMLEAGRAFRH